MKEFTIEEVKKLIEHSHKVEITYYDPFNTRPCEKVAVGDGYKVIRKLKAGDRSLVIISVDEYGKVFSTSDHTFCEQVSDCFNGLSEKKKEAAISKLKRKIKSMESSQ